ncbi:uncharacterized protein BDZ99DRAFT_209089 [Mytilinidion resinicola]|uniref:Uncharacterized protein n=1 Tax=Mytilinidion resinicola TaxID=574789 RepID=A0A6A6Y1H5_9PEZI|nr:uncharacterized protein BDZ99DRAFT_209089 [Mytilinidion resinicola]KAF2802085.1 hypothetical protein BDZ99DRAFT_209089 [Mytilinidion resinicola]
MRLLHDTSAFTPVDIQPPSRSTDPHQIARSRCRNPIPSHPPLPFSNHRPTTLINSPRLPTYHLFPPSSSRAHLALNVTLTPPKSPTNPRPLRRSHRSRAPPILGPISPGSAALHPPITHPPSSSSCHLIPAPPRLQRSFRVQRAHVPFPQHPISALPTSKRTGVKRLLASHVSPLPRLGKRETASSKPHHSLARPSFGFGCAGSGRAR